jgi:hypothetical protein
MEKLQTNTLLLHNNMDKKYGLIRFVVLSKELEKRVDDWKNGLNELETSMKEQINESDCLDK